MRKRDLVAWYRGVVGEPHRDRIPLWWLAVMGAMLGAVVWSIVWTIVLVLR